MITSSKQAWEVGQTVKSGFMTLIVKAKVATPGDYLPDAYICTNVAGNQLYKVIPHNGTSKVTADQVRELMAIAESHAARVAAQAIAKAASTREIDALFA